MDFERIYSIVADAMNSYGTKVLRVEHIYNDACDIIISLHPGGYQLTVEFRYLLSTAGEFEFFEWYLRGVNDRISGTALNDALSRIYDMCDGIETILNEEY